MDYSLKDNNYEDRFKPGQENIPPQINKEYKIESNKSSEGSLSGKVKKETSSNRNIISFVKNMASSTKLGEAKKNAEKYDNDDKNLVKDTKHKISDKKTSSTDINHAGTRFMILGSKEDKIGGIFKSNAGSESANTKNSAEIEGQKKLENFYKSDEWGKVRDEKSRMRDLDSLHSPSDSPYNRRRLNSAEKPSVGEGSPGIQRKSTFKIHPGQERKVFNEGALEDPTINKKAKPDDQNK